MAFKVRTPHADKSLITHQKRQIKFTAFGVLETQGNGGHSSDAFFW